jgi:hypothetical protein
VQNLRGESMKGMTMMELKKEGSTLLRQKSSSGENDAVKNCAELGGESMKGTDDDGAEERKKHLVETEI